MNIDNFHKLCQQKLKQELAEKVISGKKLTTVDKLNIYTLLTGLSTPPVTHVKSNRGVKLKKQRDIKIAATYRTMQEEGIKSEDAIAILGLRYELQGLETVQNRTFHKSREKGDMYLREFNEACMNISTLLFVEAYLSRVVTEEESKGCSNGNKTFKNLIQETQNDLKSEIDKLDLYYIEGVKELLHKPEVIQLLALNQADIAKINDALEKRKLALSM